MNKDITSVGSISNNELTKSLRDIVVEWSMTSIPLVFDLIFQLIQGVEDFYVAEGTIFAMFIVKFVAPVLKRWLNVWRVKTIG